MDETPIPNLLSSSDPFDDEFRLSHGATHFESGFTKGGLSEDEIWRSVWQQNGFYISDNSSSEVSLGQELPAYCPGSPVGSDSSWTEEDDTGSLFFDIEQRLRSFVLADNQTTLIIPPLNSQQRRVVHGMAHLMHLGHKTCKDDGKPCRMSIFKTKAAPSLTKLPKAAVSEDCVLKHSDYWKLPMLESATSLPARLEGNNRLSRRFEHRLRLPKRESGFPCRFSDCLKMFDRSCDRRKHEKLHEPKDNHPYRCKYEACSKTFMYPKGLRRHERVHIRRLERHMKADESSTEEVFSDTSTSSLSESPSLTTGTSSVTSMSSFFHPGLLSDEDRTPMPKLYEPWFSGDSQMDSIPGKRNDWPCDLT